MLLHRLKLKGASSCKLVDESEALKTPAPWARRQRLGPYEVVIDGRAYATRGALIYGRSSDPKRPYVYPVRELAVPGLWRRTQYVYDLGQEERGQSYPSKEPL